MIKVLSAARGPKCTTARLNRHHYTRVCVCLMQSVCSNLCWECVCVCAHVSRTLTTVRSATLQFEQQFIKLKTQQQFSGIQKADSRGGNVDLNKGSLQRTPDASVSNFHCSPTFASQKNVTTRRCDSDRKSHDWSARWRRISGSGFVEIRSVSVAVVFEAMQTNLWKTEKLNTVPCECQCQPVVWWCNCGA